MHITEIQHSTSHFPILYLKMDVHPVYWQCWALTVCAINFAIFLYFLKRTGNLIQISNLHFSGSITSNSIYWLNQLPPGNVRCDTSQSPYLREHWVKIKMRKLTHNNICPLAKHPASLCVHTLMLYFNTFNSFHECSAVQFQNEKRKRTRQNITFFQNVTQKLWTHYWKDTKRYVCWQVFQWYRLLFSSLYIILDLYKSLVVL